MRILMGCFGSIFSLVKEQRKDGVPVSVQRTALVNKH